MKINGHALKVLRERSGLSQRMLASAAGLSYTTISDLESNGVGPCQPSTATALADALKLPLLALLATEELPERARA